VFGLSTEQLQASVILIAIFLLLAFPIHECAHAFAAYRLGDATAKMYGRLSLNPVVHFDPIGGLFLVISALAGGIMFGWAKPTPVNPNNLHDRRNDEVLVSLAGPASNLVMAVVGAIVYRILQAAGLDLPNLIWYVIVLFVEINIVLAVFNLIPIPPLDGSTLLFRLVSPRTEWQLRPMLAQYGSIVLLIVIFAIWLTPLGTVIFGVVNDLTNLLLGQ